MTDHDYWCFHLDTPISHKLLAIYITLQYMCKHDWSICMFYITLQYAHMLDWSIYVYIYITPEVAHTRVLYNRYTACWIHIHVLHSGTMWSQQWGAADASSQQQHPQQQQQQHPQQQQEEFSDMFGMLGQPATEFSDLSGMFTNFTEWKCTPKTSHVYSTRLNINS